MARRWTANRRRKKAALLLVGLCLLVFLAVILRYMEFNNWVYSDARKLEEYPTVLIRNGKPVDSPPGTSGPEKAINDALIAANTRQRLVVHLSRSEVRYSIFRGRAFVKVYLETALPGEPDKIQRIKFLNVLARKKEAWAVEPDGLVQLTLP